LSLARAAILSALGAVVVASCGGEAETPAGVHVVVTMATPDAAAWSGLVFDHVTVVATSGERVAAVCLFPRADRIAPRVVEGARARAPDPCADERPSDLRAPPAVFPAAADRWQLASSPWTINVELPDGARATLRAFAAFGGSVAASGDAGQYVRASADVVAARGFPSVTLSLPPPLAGVHPFASGCLVSMAAVAPATAPRCDPSVACTAIATAPAEARTDMMSCDAPPARIVPSSASCQDGIAWRSPSAAVAGACARVTIHGRFARCASGDGPACPLTSDCLPPALRVAALLDQRLDKMVSIACAPPSARPFALTATFRTFGRPFAAAIVHSGLATASPRSCAFDLLAWEVAPASCDGVD
jgi:hypothetical protein